MSFYPLSIISNNALPTVVVDIGKAINSMQVTWSAWAAGFGNSLNLQSVWGKGDFPPRAIYLLRKYALN